MKCFNCGAQLHPESTECPNCEFDNTDENIRRLQAEKRRQQTLPLKGLGVDRLFLGTAPNIDEAAQLRAQQLQQLREEVNRLCSDREPKSPTEERLIDIIGGTLEWLEGGRS